MSMIPVLGERKEAIDDDPCQYNQSSGKEEAILVDKEEELGEKETDCDDLWRVFDELMKYNAKVDAEEEAKEEEEEEEEEGDADDGGESNLEGITCAICLSPDHLIYTCPLERGICSSTVPVVSPDYRVLCQRCGKTKFTEIDSFQTCIKCGCSVLCAVAVRCPYCLEYGHLSKKDTKCVLYGKELTRENDPLRAIFWDREPEKSP